MSPGTNILIVVKGRAPLADVPDIVGEPCADGAAMIIEAGLYPQLPDRGPQGRGADRGARPARAGTTR